MYKDVRSRVRVGDVSVRVGFHHGSVLSLHHCVRGSTEGVAHRMSTGAAVHRRPDDQCWVYCNYQYFSPEEGGGDTGGIRQQNNA